MLYKTRLAETATAKFQGYILSDIADLARNGIKEFIELYNEECLHSSIGYTNPGVVYRGEKAAPIYFLGKFIKKASKSKPV